MRRTRKPNNIIDFMLFAEDGIRQAVKEKRQELSFVRANRFDGGNIRKKDNPDTTGKTALKMMEELPSVVVAGVGTIPRPEKWIRIFDAVRGLAKQCERPELIFDEWEWRYKNGGHDYFSMDIDEIIDDESVKAGAGDPLCILRWIREMVRIQAKKEGLL